MSDFLAAVGLVFVIEGIVFAAFPVGAKRSVTRIIAMPDGSLRAFGLISALLGVVVVWLARR